MKKTLKFISIILLSILAFSLSACSKSSVEDVTQEETTLIASSIKKLEEHEMVQVDYEGSKLTIHFIDVGQGDAALITCDDESMMIDGGDSKKSDLIYTFLNEHNIDHLKYIIATHPEADHVGGLSGALNTEAIVDNAYCSKLEYNTKAFKNFLKNLDKRGIELKVPKLGKKLKLGKATCQIIGPSKSKEGNDNSLIIRIVFGDTSFLFMGDASSDEEAKLLKSKYELKSDVIKIGHHGSNKSTSKELLEKIKPKYAVISVGKNNQYGHPNDETLSLLAEKNINLFRTDLQGDITCISDGKNITFETEKTVEETPTVTEPETTQAVAQEVILPKNTYILNTNPSGNHRFHLPGCRDINKMKDSNKLEFTGTRDEVIAMGYTPCGHCHP